MTGAAASADDVPASRPTTVPAGAFIVAVMVAMALGILAVVALATGGGGDDDRTVRLSAGRFAERFLTFDHETIDDWKDDVLALSTAGFADEVEDVESGLRALISDSRLSAAARITDVFVGEEDRGSIDVVVIYDRAVDSTSGARNETNRYMQLALVRVDGEWLVDDVIDIATATAAPAPSPDADGSG